MKYFKNSIFILAAVILFNGCPEPDVPGVLDCGYIEEESLTSEIQNDHSVTLSWVQKNEVYEFVVTKTIQGQDPATQIWSINATENNDTIKIIALQPEGPFHGIEGLKHMESSIKPGFYDEDLPDIHLPVRTEDALDMTRRLAREEGLLVGISSGAAAFAAIDFAKTLKEGVIVTIFCDNGYKYLSDRFWTDGNN